MVHTIRSLWHEGSTRAWQLNWFFTRAPYHLIPGMFAMYCITVHRILVIAFHQSTLYSVYIPFCIISTKLSMMVNPFKNSEIETGATYSTAKLFQAIYRTQTLIRKTPPLKEMWKSLNLYTNFEENSYIWHFKKPHVCHGTFVITISSAFIRFVYRF